MHHVGIAGLDYPNYLRLWDDFRSAAPELLGVRELKREVRTGDHYSLKTLDVSADTGQKQEANFFEASTDFYTLKQSPKIEREKGVPDTVAMAIVAVGLRLDLNEFTIASINEVLATIGDGVFELSVSNEIVFDPIAGRIMTAGVAGSLSDDDAGTENVLRGRLSQPLLFPLPSPIILGPGAVIDAKLTYNGSAWTQAADIPIKLITHRFLALA